MHVLVVANTTWSIYNFRLGLIRALIERGFTVSILSPPDDCSKKLETIGCRVVDLALAAKGINPWEDLLLLARMIRIYHRLQPDFVIHYTIKPNIYGSMAARVTGIPSIAVTTGLGYVFVVNNWVTRIVQYLYRFALRFPKEVWFLNEEDRKTFLSHGVVPPEKAVLLHGEGVNTTHFAPVPRPSQHDGRFRFVMIARLLWDKGVGYFVEAARRVREKYPNAVFQLLGAPETANPSAISRSQIDEWEAAGWIEYLGTTSDVRPVVAQSDCVVLPSYYREGIPRCLLEASSMEIPVIATDSIGCRDVVDCGVTGFLCKVKDPVDLAEKMERLMALTPDQRVEMGVAGRRKMIDEFDETRIIESYFRVIEGVVDAE